MKNLTFPRTNSLTGRALKRLIDGDRITHRDFQNQTASYRLSSYIEQLRHRHGWDIETSEETGLTTDPTGRRACYGRYSISPDYLKSVKAELGERLQSFVESVKQFESKV